MTHYNKRYKVTERAAYREACVDVLDFLGPKRYKILARQIMVGATDGQIRLLASIAGVEGFPITAMIDRYSHD